MNRSELIAITKQKAVAYGIEPALACAIVEQESSWKTFAIRPESESGFMARYGADYTRLVKASATKVDDKWLRFEDVFYCSYGLMQTMYPVIIETFPEQAGLLEFPTDLCEPETGVTLGCRLFARYLRQRAGVIEKALLRWNGGGNPQYPAEVLARAERYR